MNCNEIQGVTSSVFAHVLFTFRRHSPHLILRLYYGDRARPTNLRDRRTRKIPAAQFYSSACEVTLYFSGNATR
jgi:hypothetical protein